VSSRLAAALAVLALAGCGGDGGPGASASAVAPADAAAFVEIDADLESDEWAEVQELLNRFPDPPQLVDRLNQQLAEEDLEYGRDVEPALGDTVALVWAKGAESDDVVFLTQPDDDEAFDALLEKAREESPDEELVTGEVDGWRAVSENQANIDALGDGDGSLADDDAFEAALGEAPDERLAFGFVRAGFVEGFGSFGTAVDAEWASGAIEARDNGAAATFTLRGDAPGGEPYDSERVDEAPGDALAFLSFDGEALRSQASQLAPLAAMLGIRIDELLEGVKGEGALWVRPGAGVPEITLVVESADAVGARAALEQLFGGLPARVQVGLVDRRVVATTGASPIEAVRVTGEPLAESEDFREAVEAAGMPDETSGFLYVNVADALPLLGLAGLAGADVPADVLENLRPIRSLTAWSEGGETSTQTMFVEIQ
jgi:hypothetical protein